MFRKGNKNARKAEGQISKEENALPFVDLTPVDDADSDGTYAKALSFALENPRIKNIALTGPYGSGKSSIIQTFQVTGKYRFLNISLASFREAKEDFEDLASQQKAGQGDTKNGSAKDTRGHEITSLDARLIERSILQQMLYGADANTLPYSRFKRIRTPVWPFMKSLVFLFWAISLAYLFVFRDLFFSFDSFWSLGPFWYLVVAFIVVVTTVLISTVYKVSFGVSLRKFSLKNAEIETGDESENSILNRHLDEIIYFFQRTEYDVVVIEDLDRFGDPEIFVKLREINKLINDNRALRGRIDRIKAWFLPNRKPIKFLYALKDDMFVHKNRAKFFDFIIPVIPVIDSSNSLDKMLERLREFDFAEKINSRFLTEVSDYIDDLRLIHNIFNELAIYYERLKSDSLNVTNLLGMMIYKNVYPSDFENLHHGRGALFGICNAKSEYIEEAKERLIEKIEPFQASIEQLNKEKVRSIRELIDIYIGRIVASTSTPIAGILVNNREFRFSNITTFEAFEPLLSDTNAQIFVELPLQRQRVPLGKSFAQVEKEINPGQTFLSRKENIEKPGAREVELQKKILLIENEIAELPFLSISQLMQRGDVSIEALIKENKIEDGRLLVYLVGNGYLDENYHFYTSNFHEGRLSRADRDFLMIIRGFQQPGPNQRVDTPSEVCVEMRNEDFAQKYVLNVTLIDYLLEGHAENAGRLDAALDYISRNFEQSEDFVSAYLVSGKHLDTFVSALSLRWPAFGAAAVSSRHAAKLVSLILSSVPADHIVENMNPDNVLGDYLSQHGSPVLVSERTHPEDYEVLKKLKVRFVDLESLDRNQALIEFAEADYLYAINTRNITYLLRRSTADQPSEMIDPARGNYTAILAFGSEVLKTYVGQHLGHYVATVLLALPENSQENEAAILDLINQESISDDLKQKIILKQEYIFPSFTDVPKSLWSFLLQQRKIAISWSNIADYLSEEENDREVVTELLKREESVESLVTQDMKEGISDEENRKTVSRFILENERIEDSTYCKLIKILPFWYRNFPEEVTGGKLQCVAKARKVRLSEDSYSFAKGDQQLLTILIEKNFEDYLKDKEKYPIDDEICELLLSSELENKHKLEVCHEVTPEGAQNSDPLARGIAAVLSVSEMDFKGFDDRILKAAILRTEEISESLRILIKCLIHWNENQVMDVLEKLSEPYSEIAAYGKRPKLDKNELNLQLAKLLKERDFISSYKEEGDSIKINTFKAPDHSEGDSSQT